MFCWTDYRIINGMFSQDVIWNLQPSKLMSKKYYILPYYKKDQWTARTKGMLGAITSQSISK